MFKKGGVRLCIPLELSNFDFHYCVDHLFCFSTESILWVYRLSHMYYSVIAMIVAVVVGVVVSLITGL